MSSGRGSVCRKATVSQRRWPLDMIFAAHPWAFTLCGLPRLCRYQWIQTIWIRTFMPTLVCFPIFRNLNGAAWCRASRLQHPLRGGLSGPLALGHVGTLARGGGTSRRSWLGGAALERALTTSAVGETNQLEPLMSLPAPSLVVGADMLAAGALSMPPASPRAAFATELLRRASAPEAPLALQPPPLVDSPVPQVAPPVLSAAPRASKVVTFTPIIFCQRGAAFFCGFSSRPCTTAFDSTAQGSSRCFFSPGSGGPSLSCPA